MLNDQELYGAKLKVVMDHIDANNTQVLPKGLKSIGPGLGVMGIHLRDVVRQYERYVKGFNSFINAGIFLDIDGKTYCKYILRHKPWTYSLPSKTKTQNNMPVRQIPQPVPPVSYVGNYRPNGPMNYGQTILGPMGHLSHMPNPGPPGPMVPNIPIKAPVGPVRPVCPLRQMGPNIPVNGPRVMGPNIGPVPAPIGTGPVPAPIGTGSVPAPIGTAPRPSNPGVGQRGPIGANVHQSPSVSPGSMNTSATQQSQEPVTVELSNVCTEYYLFDSFLNKM